MSSMSSITDLPADVRSWIAIDNVGHWLWLGLRTTSGYGRYYDRATWEFIYAHRLTYELLVGPIPAGLEVHHICRIKGCCNPDHLSLVTHRDNLILDNAGFMNPANRALRWARTGFVGARA